MTEHNINEAARLILAGQCVAAPTETVYGLFADATQDRGVAAIYDLKGRPRHRPLILHVDGPALAERVAQFDPRARQLAARFWGHGRGAALSLVLPRRLDYPLSPLVNHGGDTVALRVPDHPIALALIAAVGRPLAAPSANRFGRVSPTQSAHVREQFGTDTPFILEGGDCAIGVESTILDLCHHPAAILRPGGISQAAIEAVIGPIQAEPPTPQAAQYLPGSSASHYAPALPVRLNAEAAAARRENLLAFGPHIPPGFVRVWQLSAQGDVDEAARHLYDYLRQADNAQAGKDQSSKDQADKVQATGIAIMPIPAHGIGIAINDRLRRASHR